MINASINYSDSGSSLVLTLKGHAGYAERGKDIVCASATILAYSLAQTVRDAHAMGWLRKEPKIKLCEGDIEIVAKVKEEYFPYIQQSFFTISRGYELLKQSYPDNVNFTLFERSTE